MKKPALIGTLVGLAMAGFAVQGGEYSTLDLWRLKRQARREQEAIVRLRLEVDSLTRVQRALETDPVTQERVARETYGMIRPGETLYEVVPPDSGRER